MDMTPVTNPPLPTESPMMAAPPPPISNSSKRLWLLSGLAILVFGILLGAFGINVLNQTAIKSSPTPTPVSTTSFDSLNQSTISQAPQGDPTANWKTYNYQQLFEIKIPNDLKIIDNGRIEIGDYLSIGTYPTNPEDCRGDCPIIETKVSKTINGLEVRYLTGWWGEIGGNIAQSYIEYLIPQNGKYLYLQMQELPFSTKISLVREKVGKVSEVNSKLLDQILSTFKFADKDDTKKCFSNKDCPNNSFCDYSTPGGMGPNGFVTGQPYGSQQCILKCQNNDQCPSSQCQTFEMVTGDINNRQKGCKL